MDLTVAVCTWNRATLLRTSLEQMARLEIPPGLDWELLIIDNGSTDHTARVLDEFTSRLPLRRIFEPKPGLSHARNRAVREAVGTYIVWTDDDVLVDRQWIAAYHQAFIRFPDAALFGGPIAPAFATPPPSWLTQTWPRLSLYFAIRECGDVYEPVTLDHAPFGANFAVRADVQRRHRYDPALGRRGTELFSGEEWAVVQDILAAGGTGWWVPRASVRHHLPEDRLTTRYLRGVIECQGEASARLDTTVGVAEPHSITRIWKNAIKAELRYRLYRLFRSPQAWVEQLHLASFCRGQLRGLSAGRRFEEGSDRPEGAPIRIASWPHWYAPNRYLDLLYDALAPHGVEHVPNVPLDTRSLTIADRRIDVVHLHWPEPFWREGPRSRLGRWWRVVRLRAYLRSLRRRGVRILWTVHNLERHEGADRIDRAAYRLLHAHTDLRIFTSEWASETARQTYRDSGDTMVVPIGNFDGVLPPPTAREDVLRRLGAPSRERVLLCFGDVRSYKGFDVALDALSRLPNDRFQLIIAGRPVPPDAETIRAAAAGRANVTMVLRELTDQEVSDLLHAADAVLLPYRSITGSAALLTALTVGRGVVVSDLPYFREILASEPDAAVFVRPGDAESLAEGITRYVSADLPARGEAARRVASRYAWPEVVKPLAEWLVARASRV